MKKNLLISLLLIFSASLLSLKPYVNFKSSGSAPIGRTGAPGETTCAACHSGGTYTGSTTFQFGDKTELVYEPGETYSITLTNNFNCPRFGFSVTALDDNNEKAGDFSLVNTDNTSLGTAGNNRQYVGHKNANDNNSWTFLWQAPASDVGEITFYYVINATNNNNSPSGDNAVTGTTKIQADVGSGIEMDDNDNLTVDVFPNPFVDNITFRNIKSFDRVEIFNVEGKLVEQFNVNRKDIVTLETANYSEGYYIVKFVSSKGKYYARRIVK